MAGDAGSPTAMSLFGDILVLDLTSTIRGMHCAKMFGDYGTDTEYVFKNLLGLSDEHIKQLDDEGVLM